MVRDRLVATLEQATGGRVELGSFHWHLMRLEFEADNLTIHGLEAPGEIPYAHIDRLFVRAKIISFFRAKVGLNLLQGEHPVFHLIVYPDGSTNQPHPKTAEHHGSVTDTLFDLAVDRTEITNGVLLLNQRAIPFDLAANDLGATIEYDRARDHYLADLLRRRHHRAARQTSCGALAIDGEGRPLADGRGSVTVTVTNRRLAKTGSVARGIGLADRTMRIPRLNLRRRGASTCARSRR